MKSLKLFFLFLLSFSAAATAQAQWAELYATYDADSNGVGTNVMSVGVIHDNMFIALAADQSNSTNFLIPYVNADSAVGRKYWHGYSPDCNGYYDEWSDNFLDQVRMKYAFHIKATPDSFIYVANNDDRHNVLVFKYASDTIKAVPLPGDIYPREETGSNGIYGLDVDQNGYVYVCNDTTTGQTADVKIFKPMSQWTITHTDLPASTIDLPDGIYKGVAVSPDGHQLFIADFTNRKVLKYVGTPAGGYTADATFSFVLGPGDTTTVPASKPVPLGMEYMASHNILMVALDSWGGSTARTYDYGRIYLLNPNTGALVSNDSSVSVIDQAKWNYIILDNSYTNRGDGTRRGNASGFTSTQDVKVDGNGFVYSQSYNGWTVEKWEYKGTLPTITGIQQIKNEIPEGFRLSQNYPNPFNPSTTLEYTLARSGQVSLKIYNVLGQEVATLVDGQQPAGVFRAVFDAHGLPSGAYYAVLQTGNVRLARSMMLLK